MMVLFDQDDKHKMKKGAAGCHLEITLPNMEWN